MADYAIHDTTLIAQANVLRKKFGTNDRQDPADYADKMNLMGLLEVKSATKSAVCSFSDGADDVPISSGIFYIDYDGTGHTGMTITRTDGQTPPVESETYTVDWSGRATVYGGHYNSATGVLTLTQAMDGSTLPIPMTLQIDATEIRTLLGDNAIYCDTGDTEVDYRSSGTVSPTPIQPTLIGKNITENGLYQAEDDNADGYSYVLVGVQSAICDRLMYARCVNNDQEEIPAMSNIEQGSNYSSYLSYDSSTKKFTVLQDFTGVVVAWVYAYRTYESSRPDGAFYVNSTQMLAYTATGNAQGSTGGRSGVYNFKQGDTFWMYTPSRRGYPQQNCKVYRVSALSDNIFTFADEEDV